MWRLCKRVGLDAGIGSSLDKSCVSTSIVDSLSGPLPQATQSFPQPHNRDGKVSFETIGFILDIDSMLVMFTCWPSIPFHKTFESSVGAYRVRQFVLVVSGRGQAMDA